MIANEEQSFWTQWKVTSTDGTPSKPFENQMAPTTKRNAARRWVVGSLLPPSSVLANHVDK